MVDTYTNLNGVILQSILENNLEQTQLVIPKECRLKSIILNTQEFSLALSMTVCCTAVIRLGKLDVAWKFSSIQIKNPKELNCLLKPLA